MILLARLYINSCFFLEENGGPGTEIYSSLMICIVSVPDSEYYKGIKTNMMIFTIIKDKNKKLKFIKKILKGIIVSQSNLKIFKLK